MLTQIQVRNSNVHRFGGMQCCSGNLSCQSPLISLVWKLNSWNYVSAQISCNIFDVHLVAPYCAIPRDYLSDTPLLRAMGFLVSQHGQLGAIPPPPFLSFYPLESMRSGGAIPPFQKGYLSDTCAIPYEKKANGRDTPLCDTISKGCCAIWGGISHWAAKSCSVLRLCPGLAQERPGGGWKEG